MATRISDRFSQVRFATKNFVQRLHARFLHLTPTSRWALAGAIVMIGIGVAGYRLWFVQPTVISPTGPSLGITQVSNTKPVVIIFSNLVKHKTLRHEIYPELKGMWKIKTKLFSGQSTLTFTPLESPDLDTRYTISLSGIRSIMRAKEKKYLLSFQTDTIPVFKTVSPGSRAVDVLPDAPVILTFDKAVTDSLAVTLSITPEIAFEDPAFSDSTVTFSHAALFQKSTEYALKVYVSTVKKNYATKAETVKEEKTEVGSVIFTTIAAPGIQAYSPTGTGIDPATAIQLDFKQPMDHVSTEAAFSVTPAVAGTFTWPNDQTILFTPGQSLTKNQTYTVNLANTAKAANGFTPDESLSFTFTTVGVAAVETSRPTNGTSGVDPATEIHVTFNQDVVPASAESKFGIDPTVSGTFRWDGRTMVFQPSTPMAYGTAYTVTVSPGVQSAKGLDSTSAWSAKFTTRTPSVLLQVPAYAQAHVYSCMIAAARSALAYRGVKVSESAIITRVGKDSTAWSGTWGGDNGVWGDPEVAIVGPLDNSEARSPAGKKTTNVYWGYGSHWGPIAKALTSYGVTNEVRSGMTTKDLAQSITDGNPVIIWWVNGIWPAYEVKWKTPGGKQIRGVNGMHVQVVRGFTGTVDNPKTFTVTDSGYGYPGRSFDIGTFKAKWGWFGNTGIIVK